MSFFRLWVLMVVTGFSVLSGPTLAAAASPLVGWPASGRLAFDVLRGDGGIKLGEAEHEWRHDATRYQMSLALKTTGLLGAFIDFSYVQESVGVIVSGTLQPEVFRVKQSGREDEVSSFDWNVGKVRVVRKGRETFYDVKPGDQDVLSIWHVFALSAGRDVPGQLSLISNRRANLATITVLGRESVKVPAGQFDARRIKVRANTGKLTIDLWVSDEQHSVPVRLLLTDDKGQVLDLQARKIEIGAVSADTVKE